MHVDSAAALIMARGVSAAVVLSLLLLHQYLTSEWSTSHIRRKLRNEGYHTGHRQELPLHISGAANGLEESSETTFTVNNAKEEVSENRIIWPLSFPCRFPKNVTPPPTLQFLHIRKTGGTAIEQAFKRANITVDNYKYYEMNWAGTFPRMPNTWHFPARHYISHHQNITFFGVVRDPYERAISEYYQYFKPAFHEKPPPGGVDNETSLNEFIAQRFANDLSDLFIPQVDYLFFANGTRFVDHVLRFESLHDEFPALMECYGLDHIVQLPADQVNPRQKIGTDMGTKNLSTASIRLINHYEALIFSEFNYTMILPDDDLQDEAAKE